MVPLCMMVHSQVAVLLPGGEARAIYYGVLKYFKNRRLEKCTHAVQIVANLLCPINRQIGFGLRICTIRKKHQIQ